MKKVFILCIIFMCAVTQAKSEVSGHTAITTSTDKPHNNYIDSDVDMLSVEIQPRIRRRVDNKAFFEAELKLTSVDEENPDLVKTLFYQDRKGVTTFRVGRITKSPYYITEPPYRSTLIQEQNLNVGFYAYGVQGVFNDVWGQYTFDVTGNSEGTWKEDIFTNLEYSGRALIICTPKFNIGCTLAYRAGDSDPFTAGDITYRRDKWSFRGILHENYDNDIGINLLGRYRLTDKTRLHSAVSFIEDGKNEYVPIGVRLKALDNLDITIEGSIADYKLSGTDKDLRLRIRYLF